MRSIKTMEIHRYVEDFIDFIWPHIVNEDDADCLMKTVTNQDITQVRLVVSAMKVVFDVKTR